MKETELKPCPFCRNVVVYDTHYMYDGYQNESPTYRIKCQKCGLMVETTNPVMIDEMIKRWNFCSDTTEPVDIDSLL